MGDTDIALDSAGNVYVSAWYNGTVNIGQQTLIANTPSGSTLVSKWNNAGMPLWAVSTQGLSYVSKIAIDKNTGDGYLSGDFSKGIGFGPHYVNAPDGGFFLAKFSSNPTGIAEAFSQELSIYPNPAQTVLFLNLPEAKGIVHVQLTDMQGKTVLSRQITAAAEMKLELPELSKGMYILQAQTAKHVLRRKVVIE
ncbi:T9SS type A sorting domain-containing protein [Adhaeribacter terreus]|uniref:T9SS type A sorting domain-containing protein n=1 Tax=Adhaeribacter terreus TaxID=529703 RepID=A0ABW0E5C4_9BACT